MTDKSQAERILAIIDRWLRKPGNQYLEIERLSDGLVYVAALDEDGDRLEFSGADATDALAQFATVAGNEEGG